MLRYYTNFCQLCLKHGRALATFSGNYRFTEWKTRKSEISVSICCQELPITAVTDSGYKLLPRWLQKTIVYILVNDGILYHIQDGISYSAIQ